MYVFLGCCGCKFITRRATIKPSKKDQVNIGYTYSFTILTENGSKDIEELSTYVRNKDNKILDKGIKCSGLWKFVIDGKREILGISQGGLTNLPNLYMADA